MRAGSQPARLQRASEEDGYILAEAVWPDYRALWRALVRPEPDPTPAT